MPNIQPAFAFLAVVAMAAAATLVASFRSVFLAWDAVAFAIALAVFLAAAWFLLRKIRIRFGDGGTLVLGLGLSAFAYYNLFVMAMGYPLDVQVKVMAALLLSVTAALAAVAWIGGRGSNALRTVAAGLLAAIAVAPATGLALSSTEATSQGVRQTVLSGAHEASDEPPPNLRHVTFQRTPNVYLVGMSAATAEAILQKHLEIEVSPLNEYLRGAGFRIFRNAFVEAQLSRNSYDMLLSMHRQNYRAIKATDRGLMLSGSIPTPLFAVFRNNGYEVNSLAEAAKFGGMQGPYVDHYEIAVEPSVCNNHFVSERVKRIMFVGACILRKSALFSLTRVEKDDIIDFYFDKLTQIAERPTPQFTFIHVRPPYHYMGEKYTAPAPEQLAKFREAELGWLAQAAKNLDRLMRLIAEADPTALVLTFGDHGLSLSGEPNPDEAPSPFYVRDRYAVLAAMHPPDACADYLPPADANGFVTVPQLVRSVLECLSGGEDPYLGEYEHRAVLGDIDIDLTAYRYE